MDDREFGFDLDFAQHKASELQLRFSEAPDKQARNKQARNKQAHQGERDDDE